VSAATTPLLAAGVAERCRAWAEHILEVLHRRRAELLDGGPWVDAAADLALLFHQAARSGMPGPWSAAAESCLEQAFDRAAAVASAPRLFGGFVWPAFVAAHIHGDDPAARDALGDVDAALLAALERPRWDADFDLAFGLAGLGTYALERWPGEGAARMLERVVFHLGETARPVAGGIAWQTPPERLPPAHLARYPRGYLNLGVAHGLPGVLPVLAAACRLGIAASQSRRLLDGGIRFLLETRLPPSSPSQFPLVWTEGGAPEPAQLGWCYGDLGIASALALVASLLDDGDLEQDARELALAAAARARESTGVRDVGLCHGASGNGHLFLRLWRQLGDEPLAGAARLWFDDVLARRTSNDLGDVTAVHADGRGGFEERSDPTFLTGAAGTALALLAASDDVDASWDRALLVSTRLVGVAA
jgi:lantibiotic biosynthesis protein